MAANSYSTSRMKPGDIDIYSAVMPTVELEEFDEGGDDRQNQYYDENDHESTEESVSSCFGWINNIYFPNFSEEYVC
jgi:hypothetical protein